MIKGLSMCHCTGLCVHFLCLCPSIGAGADSGAGRPGRVPTTALAPPAPSWLISWAGSKVRSGLWRLMRCGIMMGVPRVCRCVP